MENRREENDGRVLRGEAMQKDKTELVRARCWRLCDVKNSNSCSHCTRAEAVLWNGGEKQRRQGRRNGRRGQ